MVVNLIAMPFMSMGLLPLVVIFYCLRNYYLKTSSEIKRLETSGNYDSILLQQCEIFKVLFIKYQRF